MSTAKTGATGHTPSVKIEETTKDGEVITIVNPHKKSAQGCLRTVLRNGGISRAFSGRDVGQAVLGRGQTTQNAIFD
jgi:hypothetical protein